MYYKGDEKIERGRRWRRRSKDRGRVGCRDMCIIIVCLYGHIYIYF
jgi:hypothetical protein